MVEIKCDTCLGCNRLEMPEFEGVYRCENYIDGRKEEKNNINVFTYPNTHGIIDT